MGIGEIARYEQFFLFPQCFQKACFQGCQKVSLCGNELKDDSISIGQINPLTDNKVLDQSKFKQIADDIIKCI